MIGPDILLLAAEWQPRALIRAQLIEEGFETVATNTWPMMRRHLRPGMKPRVAIVDLKGLPNPDRVLQDLRVLMKPDRVVVLTAIGTVSPADVRRLGFQALSRPIVIEDIVGLIARMIRSATHATVEPGIVPDRPRSSRETPGVNRRRRN